MQTMQLQLKRDVTMSEIKEIKLKKNADIHGYIDKVKESLSTTFETDNVKLVGITFHFLVDDVLLSSQGLYSKGFDPDEWGDSDVH